MDSGGAMTTVTGELTRPYDIAIGQGLLQQVGERLKALEGEGIVSVKLPDPVAPEILKIAHEDDYVDRFLGGV